MKAGSIFKKMLLIPVIMVLIVIVFGLGFAHEEHLDGPYYLIAVDIDADMSLSYYLSDTAYMGRIRSTVFAVGWNQDYFVAKQHPYEERYPYEDRIRTEYYYLIRALDHSSASPEDSVRGPFSKADFEKEKERLRLPDFSRELAALK